MSFQGTSEGQRFCQRCGAALSAGRCPSHGFDTSARSSGASGAPRAWPTATPAAPSWSPRPSDTPSPTSFSPAGRRDPSLTNTSSLPPWLGVTALVVAAVMLLALVGDHVVLQSAVDSNRRQVNALDQRLSDELAATNALAQKVTGLVQTNDPSVVAAKVRASVYTINTPQGLGSGWVVSSTGGSSLIVTDYHVISDVMSGPGAHTVQVEQNSSTLTGTVSKVDAGDDLAVITVKSSLAPLARAPAAPMVGDDVLVVGSPLGLSGTVSNGIVSSFRNGLIQFSAPISPGDSGGPVVNSAGQVIGVAESKLVGTGVEGLSFAIPITTVCSTVTTC